MALLLFYSNPARKGNVATKKVCHAKVFYTGNQNLAKSPRVDQRREYWRGGKNEMNAGQGKVYRISLTRWWIYNDCTSRIELIKSMMDQNSCNKFQKDLERNRKIQQRTRDYMVGVRTGNNKQSIKKFRWCKAWDGIVLRDLGIRKYENRWNIKLFTTIHMN